MMASGTKITKDVDVDLSAGEKHELGHEIAEHVREYNALESRKKEVTGDLTKQMKAQRKEIDRKSKALLEGKIARPVPCESTLDFDTNRVIIRRLDTGAIVSERPMTGEERQTAMFEDPPSEDEEPAPIVEPSKEPKVRAKRGDH